MLTIHSGHNNALSKSLCEQIKTIPSERDIYIVVPKQLTLLTEQIIMHDLDLAGSFRIQVYNTTRICTAIFNEAGFPDGDHIDERGRVMMCRRAAHAVRESLSIYRGAEQRTGFAAKCAQQLQVLLQGGVSPDQLQKIAGDSTGTDARKLHDLSLIMEKYNELTEGQYQDTETELIASTERVDSAPFIRNASFCFFGFAIIPPILTDFMAAIATHAVSVDVFFAYHDTLESSDESIYLPIRKTIDRLQKFCMDRGVAVCNLPVENVFESTALTHLTDQMYEFGPCQYKGDFSAIHSFTAPTVTDECLTVAAMARKLCRENGYRCNEIKILCTDPDSYRLPLREAFEKYDLPIMVDTGRAVSRVGAAEFLLLTLRVITDGYRTQDLISLVRTGLCGVTYRDADILENYCIKHGIEGNRWKKPCFGINTTKEDYSAKIAENIRCRLIPAIDRLQTELVKAKKLRQQLSALYNYLTSEELSILSACRLLANRLADSGKPEESGLITQSWNRLITTLDMMNDLLGTERLSLSELYQTLLGSLEVSVIKILPQSADRVCVHNAGSMLYEPAKVLFVLGLWDRGSTAPDGLLQPAQTRLISESLGTYLGPDDIEAPLRRRYFLKESLTMASEQIVLSCSMVDLSGSSHKRGEELKLLPDIFPGFKDISSDTIRSMLPQAIKPALEITSPAFGEGDNPAESTLLLSLKKISETFPELNDELERLRKSASALTHEDHLKPENADRIYDLETVSISMLEDYASCPFSHYIKYGLKPQKVLPFEITSADIGTILHACLNRFLIATKDSLNNMTPDEASNLMHDIADAYISEQDKAINMIESSSVSRQEYDDLISRACSCASAFATHMHHSNFQVRETEMLFNTADSGTRIPGSNSTMRGSIDRVDVWDNGKQVRIVDYKSSCRTPDPAEILDGSALQLATYLGIAGNSFRSAHAGMYYFPMLDEYLVNDSRNPIEIEQERVKRMRMSGLMPADSEELKNQAENPEVVFDIKLNKDGSYPKNSAVATPEDFSRLISHTRNKSAQHIHSIQNGNCRILPTQHKNFDSCKYCDYRSACFFDPAFNKKRRIRPATWEDLFTTIALNSDTGNPDPKT